MFGEKSVKTTEQKVAAEALRPLRKPLPGSADAVDPKRSQAACCKSTHHAEDVEAPLLGALGDAASYEVDTSLRG